MIVDRRATDAVSVSQLVRCALLVNDPEVDRSRIQAAFDEVFDQAIVFHGFTDYMRDYDILVLTTADTRTKLAPHYLRYRFKCCVRATVTSALSPQIWTRSLDERLIDYHEGLELDGYVWGVKWQNLYPGMTLIEESTDAQQWSEDLGMPFYEATIETNAHNINLVFADLDVDAIGKGFAPFVVEVSGSEA